MKKSRRLKLDVEYYSAHTVEDDDSGTLSSANNLRLKEEFKGDIEVLEDYEEDTEQNSSSKIPKHPLYNKYNASNTSKNSKGKR